MRRTVLALLCVGIALTAASQAWAQPTPNPSSGMLLGVYAFPTSQGLRISGIIPGYSAEGRIFPNDVLLRVTDGQAMFSIKNHSQIERAKSEIGENVAAALELYRPRFGKIYLWVTFTPVENMAAEPRYQTEAERPGAKALFDGENSQPNGESGPIQMDDPKSLFD